MKLDREFIKRVLNSKEVWRTIFRAGFLVLVTEVGEEKGAMLAQRIEEEIEKVGKGYSLGAIVGALFIVLSSYLVDMMEHSEEAKEMIEEILKGEKEEEKTTKEPRMVWVEPKLPA